jgi:hypothetical protein
LLPHELIRAAIGILTSNGWSQGAAARNHYGEQLPLYLPATGGDSRARIHPDAVSFSIYGALAKAMGDAGTAVANPGLLWATLDAAAKLHVVPGGTNHLHALIAFNEVEGRTHAEVLEFLEGVALQLEETHANAQPAA